MGCCWWCPIRRCPRRSRYAFGTPWPALARTACFHDFIAYGHIYGHDFMHERQPFVHNVLFPAALV
jgi:hypothetical protein